MLAAILKWLGGGVIGQFTGPLLQAYQARLNADNDQGKRDAELTIQRIEAARDIALAEASRAWSATSVGRWLIVVPFGLWWAAIFTIQMANPWFGWHLVVIDVPPDIKEMAKILVPAIVIADAGAFAVRKIGGR